MVDVFALATYMFVMSITPGPNTVMLTASGANFGFRRTLPHRLGVSLGFAFQTALVCLGLGALFIRVPHLQAGLAWVGAAYLVYMAWRLLGARAVGQAQSARPLMFVESATFQFVNPKAWLMAITIATLFLPKNGSLVLALAVMLVVMIGVNFGCITLWAGFGSSMRRFLDHAARRRIFNTIMAALLAATAVLMVVG